MITRCSQGLHVAPIPTISPLILAAQQFEDEHTGAVGDAAVGSGRPSATTAAASTAAAAAVSTKAKAAAAKAAKAGARADRGAKERQSAVGDKTAAPKSLTTRKKGGAARKDAGAGRDDAASDEGSKALEVEQALDVWIRKEVAQLSTDHPGDRFAWHAPSRVCMATLKVHAWVELMKREVVALSRRGRAGRAQKAQVAASSVAALALKGATAVAKLDEGLLRPTDTIHVRVCVPTQFPKQHPSFAVRSRLCL